MKKEKEDAEDLVLDMRKVASKIKELDKLLTSEEDTIKKILYEIQSCFGGGDDGLCFGGFLLVGETEGERLFESGFRESVFF